MTTYTAFGHLVENWELVPLAPNLNVKGLYCTSVYCIVYFLYQVPSRPARRLISRPFFRTWCCLSCWFAEWRCPDGAKASITTSFPNGRNSWNRKFGAKPPSRYETVFCSLFNYFFLAQVRFSNSKVGFWRYLRFSLAMFTLFSTVVSFHFIKEMIREVWQPEITLPELWVATCSLEKYSVH